MTLGQNLILNVKTIFQWIINLENINHDTTLLSLKNGGAV